MYIPFPSEDKILFYCVLKVVYPPMNSNNKKKMQAEIG